MKNLLLLVGTTFAYLVIWFLLAAVAIFINLTLFGRPAGSITAIGGIFAFWASYKIVKWLKNKYVIR
jgi:hypothetical protein